VQKAQRHQIARLWQLRAMDNLNGLKGYVRAATPTPVPAEPHPFASASADAAAAAVLCVIFWLFAEDSGYARCIFDVNNNARLKVTAKLKWHWLQRWNKGAASQIKTLLSPSPYEFPVSVSPFHWLINKICYL